MLDAGICFSSRPRQTFSNSQPEQELPLKEKSLHISYNVGLLPVGEAVMFVFDGFDGLYSWLCSCNFVFENIIFNEKLLL